MIVVTLKLELAVASPAAWRSFSLAVRRTAFLERRDSTVCASSIHLDVDGSDDEEQWRM